MNVITVNELYKALGKIVKAGGGDKKCLLADDDEGNGYHEMFFTVVEADDFDDACMPYGINKSEYVIVG